MKVVIDAQLVPGGHAGGVEQFLVALVRSLSGASIERLTVVGPWQNPRWLAHLTRGSIDFVAAPAPLAPAVFQRVPLFVRPALAGAWIGSKRLLRAGRGPWVPESNGFYEALAADVVHFPIQRYARSGIPDVYNPHDLLHRHFPEFLTPDEIAIREAVYSAGCREATIVAAESEWAKKDIVSQYSVDPSRVRVIRLAPPTQLGPPEDPSTNEAVRSKFDLPELFLLYPAQTWPHKNHIRLVEAVALLRDRENLKLFLVCTGTKNAHWLKINNRMSELGLENQVRFLGFVPQGDLKRLYALASGVVIPSLFEGGGFPLLEAFLEGVPVACSGTTALPEYGGDAAIYFDPLSVEEIVESLRSLIGDADLKEELVKRGRARLKDLSWQATASAYLDLYAEVAPLGRARS